MQLHRLFLTATVTGHLLLVLETSNSFQQHRNNMGSLFSSLFGSPPKQDQRFRIIENVTTSISKNQQKKMLHQSAAATAWTRVSHAFSQQLLHPSYITTTVRASTVQAAALYPTRDENTTIRKTLMPGSHKHLGGAYDSESGCIFGVPANSQSILVLRPVFSGGNSRAVMEYSMTIIALPAEVAAGRMKWLRGIVVHDQLWAIPAWAPAVLCVDLKRAAVATAAITSDNSSMAASLVPLPTNYQPTEWQWHGAGLNHEKTAIFCIPSNATHVLRVDLLTRTTSFLDISYDATQYPSFDLTLPNKWYGGLVGHDNCVYGIPYRASAVLKIDTTAGGTASLIGPDHGANQFYWHGGILCKGKIYAHPSHADTVLVIDTRVNRPHDVPQCVELPIRSVAVADDILLLSQQHHQDTTTATLPPALAVGSKRYKWLGGAIGADGNIYCPACDASAVLVINTATDVCTTFGFVGGAKNKWQGGLLGRDGCVYCIPANGQHVLRIHTNPLQPNDATFGGAQPVQLVGNLPAHKDKWQGGSVGKDGCLYFMPENGYRVLKVTPPEKPPVLVNGKLPENDVKLEFL
jgi:hypothetical protein